MRTRRPAETSPVLKDLPDGKDLPPVRVVAFSGRETDVPHGIWGEIARQIGKQDAYSPLKAPGRTAWLNLLKGEPTLIDAVIVDVEGDEGEDAGEAAGMSKTLTPEERAFLERFVKALAANQERDPKYAVVLDCLKRRGWLEKGCIVFSSTTTR